MSTMERITQAALRSALLWGALASVAFFAALEFGGQWINPVVARYLTGHWAAYVVEAMFLTGVAALAIKCVDLVRESLALRQAIVSPVAGEQPISAAATLLKSVENQPAKALQLLGRRRFRDALRFVVRQGSAEGFDEQLRNLAENEQSQMAASYALPRFLIWAIPAVGSLGAVVGIASAVAQLATQSPDDPFSGVSARLALAFETTALSLSLAIGLVMLKFICEQQELQLLGRVDDLTRRELLGRFAAKSTSSGAQVDELRKLTESLVEATSQLARRPAGGGDKSGGGFGDRSGEQIEAIVAAAVAKTLAAQLPNGAAAAGGAAPTGWGEIQQALQQNTEFMAQQQAEMAQQSRIISQLTEMLTKDSKNWPARKRMRADHDKPESSSLSGLWNAMNE